MKAIRGHHPGSPDVLVLEDVSIRQPRLGEGLVRNRAIGVNFVDTYPDQGGARFARIL